MMNGLRNILESRKSYEEFYKRIEADEKED